MLNHTLSHLIDKSFWYQIIMILRICFSIIVNILIWENERENNTFSKFDILNPNKRKVTECAYIYSFHCCMFFFENNIFSLMGKFLLCHGFHICHYVTNVDNNKCVVVIINNYVHSSACKHNLDIDKLLFSKYFTI